MNTHEYTAPSSWASYFVNGDPSGLEESEIEQANTFLARLGLGTPLGAEDAGFLSRHDAWCECPLAGDCQIYTFLV